MSIQAPETGQTRIARRLSADAIPHSDTPVVITPTAHAWSHDGWGDQLSRFGPPQIRGWGDSKSPIKAESAQIPYGLPGAALAVLFRLGEPVQARIAGDGIELFTGEEPFGQVRGHRGGGGGDEAVLGVDGEVEVVGQRQILISWVSGAPRWSEARRAAPGGR